MDRLYQVINLDIENKIGNLTACAKGKVKSTKYFPIFEINHEKYVFKPLSKTKPYTTSLFAYSEVYWSYIVRSYFMKEAFQYRLAIVNGMSKQQEKYYDKGSIVKLLTKPEQKLVSIYEYFQKHPEPTVNIANYINYCEAFYDYSFILKSDFISKNPQLGEKIAYQILLSILRQDQNYHYENVNLIWEKGEIIDVALPIDYEFSSAFLFPDMLDKHIADLESFYNSLLPIKQADLDYLKRESGMSKEEVLTAFQSANYKNILTIIKLYPKVISQFVANMKDLINDISYLNIVDTDGYITKLNSYSFQIGQLRYKQNAPKEAQLMEQSLTWHEIDKEKCFKEIIKETYFCSRYLINLIEKYQKLINKGNQDLESLTFEQVENLMTLNNTKSLKRKIN